LPLAGFTGTPEEIERQWFEKVYRGRGDSMVQLTWRAVLMGSVLGGVLSFTNIYIGLKSGWLFGVAITACILSYIIWTALYKIRLVRTPMTILENNCMQSTASAAGYGTGSTLVSAFAAYIMLNGQSLSTPLTMAWVFFLAVLGVTMAVPMKRQMINVEQLRFPSGIAAAETLKALHSHGAKGVRAARALGWAGVIAAIDKFWVEGLHLLSAKLAPVELGSVLSALNKGVLGQAWIGRTVSFSWDFVFVGAGMLTGMHVGWSMLLGGTLCWAVFVPLLQAQGVVTSAGTFKDFIAWTLWGGVACMVTNALLMFVLQWRTALRAFAGIGKLFSMKKADADDEMAAIETPGSWFVAGQLVSLIALSWLAHSTFGMPIWQSALAVVMSFFLALVACRVTGETDATPMGAMGKVTQLTFGLISPGNMNVNLMSANITAGAASSSADLLTDLKSGYLLGANPRKQFLAQFAGIFVGTVATVLCFKLMVTKPEDLGTERFPAPSALQWKAVAELMSQGTSLGPIRIWSMIIGGALGLLFPVLSKLFPRCQKYIPSATGFGFAWVFPWYNALMFFLGGLLGWLWERRNPAQAREFLYPVASGIVAGGSLMGVTVILWENGPALFRTLFRH
jgi:OPT family oligopeptide transporter